MARWNINTPMRQAAFLAQVMHESGMLASVEENLNYSAKGLMETWPKRFTSLAIALAYERRPEKIANKVYANRMGNRDEASGDGWKHRGAGLIQLTGKDNHLTYAFQADKDALTIGEYMRSTEGACDVSGWFWSNNNLNKLADKDDLDGVSDIINLGRQTAKVGDAIGYAHRLEMYNAFKKALGVK
jgi:putative chitinase